MAFSWDRNVTVTNGTGTDPSARSKWRILVAHPGRQHSHQAALALHEAGCLACYATGIPVSRRQFGRVWRWLLDRYSLYDEAPLLPESTQLNMLSSIANRILLRHLPEYIGIPIQYEMYRMFDRWAAKLIARLHVDAVIAYENSALYTFEAARKIGATCILDAASLHHVEQDRHYVSRLPRAYKARIDLLKDKELSLADYIFTASDLAAESYLANGYSKSCVKTILLGVDLRHFRPAQTCGTRHQSFTFAFVGSGTLKKGFDLVLDCMEVLLSEGVSLELLVAGRVDRQLLVNRNAVQRRIREYGFVRQSELAALLTQAHCLLLPSRFDSFGMVVPEAMACGLPVIVSNMVGARQLVEEGRNGFVVPVGSHDALARKMRWCALNPELLKEMSMAARATAEQVSWPNYRRRFAAAVQKVLSGT
jgi:glycosyltransferase involved in cell wall biosynthesis